MRQPEKELLTNIIDAIVDMTVAEYPNDGQKRLNMYALVSDNLAAMVRTLGTPTVTETEYD